MSNGQEKFTEEQVKEAIDTAEELMKKKKYNEALPHLEIAANSGNASAQYDLGSLYSGDRGVSQDDEKSFTGTAENINAAKTWFKKAADQGHKEARETYKKFFG